ncbi:hypothetical protein SAMN04489729_6197 [Amycolatopsis lurida]|uniref:Uncharacterized protein n=1 Tax=Amycolatopsis lurida NRRL 2430 TaxID=1460371 RepID=A0A2P2G146_AMYLU|nr:hypothetical protein [Amycolatopsis lurida]KFU82692.1 hypothetical protein BB31_03070 [Amycolatopsis lurida NRRL 2430]SEE05914.1 hypothetical protein SAMN04489729_6197 [Amycolatopsis lurida]
MTFQQYPPQGYPAPGAYPPGPMRQPSGATAIIAGILAILGGLWFLAGLVSHIIELSDYFISFLLVGAALDLVSAALLLGGGIMLLLRKRAGRVLTVIGAASAIGFVALTFLLRAFDVHYHFSYSGVTLFFGFGWLLFVVLIPAIATLVLALVPPTVRWLAAKPQAGAAQPPNFGYPPPQPGYPPAPGAQQQGQPPGQW